MPKVKNRPAAQQPIKPQEPTIPVAADRAASAAAASQVASTAPGTDSFVSPSKIAPDNWGDISTFLPNAERDNLARTSKAARAAVMQVDHRITSVNVDELLNAYKSDLANPEVMSPATNNPVRVKVEGPTQAKAMLEFVRAHKEAPLKIEGLDFKGQKITDKYLELIGSVKGLRHLSMNYCKISPAQIQSMMALENLSSLQHLDMAMSTDNNGLDGRISQHAAFAIAASKNMKNLRHLNLIAFYLFGNGVKAIAESKNMQNLEHLNLKFTQAGDTGAQAIIGSANMKNLTYLNLADNGIMDRGVQTLAGSRHMSNLQHLHLEQNFMSEAMLKSIALSEILKNCEITRSV